MRGIELSVFVASLVDGARVLYLGDSTERVQDAFIRAGARSVHVFDPVAHRVRALRDRQTTVAALGGDFDVRDGAFDLALISELGAVVDPPALLSRVRRVLSPRGVLVLASANPETPSGRSDHPDYYRLYDAVSLQFAVVRMFGAFSFFGRVLAEFGAEDPSTSVDTELAPARGAPAEFVVVASQEEGVQIDGFSILELSRQEIAPVSLPVAGALDEHTAEIAQAKLQVKLLSAQLDEERAKRALFSSSESDVRRLETHLRDARHRGETLTRELVVANERIVALEAQATLLEARAEERAKEAREALDELRRLKEQREAPDRVRELERELEKSASERETEVHAFEEKLQERAEILEDQRREIIKRDGIVQDLLRSMATGGSMFTDSARETPAPGAPLPRVDSSEKEARLQLDALAMDVARREGEIRANAWRIAELEEQLGRLRAPAKA